MTDLMQFVPFVLMLVVMYVLVIRPQVKEKEAHDKMVASLAKDDRVVAGSGIHGRVVRVDERTLEIEIARGVQIKLDRTSVQRKLGADGNPVEAPK